MVGVGPSLMINGYLYGPSRPFRTAYFLNLENSHPWLTLFDAEEGVPSLLAHRLGFHS